MNLCKNCRHELTGPYCAHCGLPAVAKRIDGHYIQHEIEHVLHFEKGILLTIKELMLRPGENVKEFIAENRSKLVKPIIFIIVSSLIYSITSHYFHIEDGYINYQNTNVTYTSSIMTWIQSHYGYGNIIMGIFISFWLKLFFKKYDYNFFELLILLCFVMGMAMLIFSLFALFQGVTHIKSMTAAGVVGMIYLTWSIGQFFDKGKIVNYVKAFVCYMLGMLSFTIIALLLGGLLDILFKHH
ncbi:DUF3667 domain-containing protein [Pedobacter sp. PWIIR3]